MLILNSSLPERVAEDFDLNGGGDAFVEDVIDGIENGHVDAVVAVDFLHTFGAVVAFGNHFHLELCGLDGVALSNHRTEHAVAAEVGIHRDEQVAQIDAVADVAVGVGLDGVQESLHLLQGIGDEDCLKVVTEFEAVADTCCDGIDVLQHRTEFDAFDVGTYRGLDGLAGEHVGNNSGILDAAASDGKITQAVESYFLGMGWASDAGNLTFGHIIRLLEIAGHGDVFVGYDTLDGCHHHLVTQIRLEFLEVALDVGRRGDKDERVGTLHHVVDVRGEVDAVGIEMQPRQVGWVVSEPLELLDAVVTTDVPVNRVFVVEHNLCNGRCPTATSHDCDSSTSLELHILVRLTFNVER